MQMKEEELTQEKKEGLIKQYKAERKKPCVVFLILDIVSVIILSIFIIVGAISEIIALIIVGLFFSGAGIVPFSILLSVKYKQYKSFGTKELEEQMREISRIKNAGDKGENFRLCEEMDCFCTTIDFGRYIKFDSNKKLWCLPAELSSDKRHIKLYKFQDIIDVQLLEDGNQKTQTKSETSGGTGRAIAGGLLFGGVGAVVGSMTASKDTESTTKTSTTCFTLQLRIIMNTVQDSIKIIDFITKEIDKSDAKYREANKMAHEIAATVLAICKENEASKPQAEAVKEEIKETPQSERAAQTETKATASENTAEELKKYKELLDSGILTEEEFSAKKKQLLGL